MALGLDSRGELFQRIRMKKSKESIHGELNGLHRTVLAIMTITAVRKSLDFQMGIHELHQWAVFKLTNTEYLI